MFCSTSLACSMVVAPARRSSVTSRFWRIDASRSTRPIACGERAKICWISNSRVSRANWVDSYRTSPRRAFFLKAGVGHCRRPE